MANGGQAGAPQQPKTQQPKVTSPQAGPPPPQSDRTKKAASKREATRVEFSSEEADKVIVGLPGMKGDISTEKMGMTIKALNGLDSKQVAKELVGIYRDNPKLVAEMLRQLSGAGKGVATDAYVKGIAGISDILSYRDVEHSWHRDVGDVAVNEDERFVGAVANSNGPGAERVKSDVCLILSENASKTGNLFGSGRDLGKVLDSDPHNIVQYLENDIELKNKVPRMLENVLRYDNRDGDPKRGQKTLASMFAKTTAEVAKEIFDKPDQGKDAANNLGQLIAHFDSALKNKAQDTATAIQEGRDIVHLTLDATATLLPEAKPATEILKKGIDVEVNRELKNVEEGAKSVRLSMHDVIDLSFKQVVDPKGDLAMSRSKEYEKAYKTFQEQLNKGMQNISGR
jgi:hypothetical protein